MKKAGVLGTGTVGRTIATKLIELGFEVKMGSRTHGNEKAVEWTKANGENASHGTFDEAADFAEVLFLCVKGLHSLDAVKLINSRNLKGKTLIDVTNPLDFSKGMPPFLAEHLSNTNSLGEEIQKALPETYVVKTLNIVNCEVMVNPSLSGGDPTMFVCGNDGSSKATVIDILELFGWKDIIDLGDITTARGPEMMLPVWIRTWVATQNGHIAFKILR